MKVLGIELEVPPRGVKTMLAEAGSSDSCCLGKLLAEFKVGMRRSHFASICVRLESWGGIHIEADVWPRTETERTNDE